MKLTRRKIDASFERRFVIGLIVSTSFIKRVGGIYRKDLIDSKIVVVIAEWCFRFFEQYGEAPKHHIQDLFELEESKLDEDFSFFVEELLKSLNEEWERGEENKFNVDFLLDESEKYFKGKAILQLSSSLKDKVSNGNVLDAEITLANFSGISRPKGEWKNPIVDEELIKGAFEELTDPLFKLPSALGEMINPQLTRGSFIALLGREKIGKSFWLMELAMRALRGRCNVAFFELGDSMEKQWTARLHSYLSSRPSPRFIKNAKEIRFPVLDCDYNQDSSCRRPERREDRACSACKYIKPKVRYEQKLVEPITYQEAIKTGQRFYRTLRGKHFRCSFHLTETFKISDIDRQLEAWKNTDGFVPDVVVIDYIDISAAEDKRKDERGQHNDRWVAARHLSQKWKVLLFTASQADADSYVREVLTMRNFSGDKRKHGHVTAEYALNQTKEERADGLLRVNEIVVRDGGLTVSNQVVVGECRQISRPYLFSYFLRR